MKAGYSYPIETLKHWYVAPIGGLSIINLYLSKLGNTSKGVDGFAILDLGFLVLA